MKVKVGALSREDQQPLKEKDLTKGSHLVVTASGTDYPVTFVDFAGPGLFFLVQAPLHGYNIAF